jgi:hypothetical protein
MRAHTGPILQKVKCVAVVGLTTGALLAVTASISSVAQGFMAKAGAPAEAFPNPDRAVAGIVSPIWHNEKERDDAGEARQLVPAGQVYGRHWLKWSAST